MLGSKEFVERVMEKIGDKARVEAEKPESRAVFAPGIEEIVRATAKEYGKGVEEIKGRRKRGEENEARMMAIYLSRELGGHRQMEIGKALGLEKSSSVSSAYLRMKSALGREGKLARRARKIEKRLDESLSLKQT